jgi:DMSO/TMAO reductase YedYZ molybdopterin-dependent catalytic subunit
LKKTLFQISLLAMAFGLILSSSLTGVFGLEVSSAVNATTNNDSATRLIVDGLVNNTLTLSLDDLAAMPKSIVYAELYCYGLIVTSGNWGGVNLGLLLNMAGVDQQTASVEFHAQDGYSITLSITEAMREDVIIAYEKDGQPLTEKLRLVVPGANGDIWISMITDLVIHGTNGDLWISMITDLVDHGAKSDISISVPQPSQAPNQFPTPQSSPTPQPENQSVTSPVIPPSNSQPVQQHSSSGSSLPMEYGYLILSAIIVSAATGYLFYKRRK